MNAGNRDQRVFTSAFPTKYTAQRGVAQPFALSRTSG